jgi:intein-encoded DNA endonuclease-like protein
MKENGASQRHQNNNLKAILSYSQFLGPRHLKNINKKEMVIKLYNEGKSTREIAKEVKISLRDIGIILREYYKEPEPEKSKSNRARSIEMFREGKDTVEVLTTLDLKYSEVRVYYGEFLTLKNLSDFINFYREYREFLPFLL